MTDVSPFVDKAVKVDESTTVQSLGPMGRLFAQEDLNFLLTNRIPRHAATLLMGRISRIRNRAFTRLAIAVWQRFTPLDLSDALHTDFESIHDCFTRQLAPGARAVDARDEVLCSPCDAIVGAFGRVEQGLVLQAKGMPYTLRELVGPSVDLSAFEHGHYMTLRLTSTMYHRFHAPSELALEHVTYISGDTWNVNPIALRRVERLFCRNERAVMRTRLADGTPMLLIPVAAVLVASMRLRALDVLLHLRYSGPNEIPVQARYARGEEMGWFEHGSTVIALTPPTVTPCASLQAGQMVRMGQALWTAPSGTPSKP